MLKKTRKKLFQMGLEKKAEELDARGVHTLNQLEDLEEEELKEMGWEDEEIAAFDDQIFEVGRPLSRTAWRRLCGVAATAGCGMGGCLVGCTLLCLLGTVAVLLLVLLGSGASIWALS